MQNITPAKVKTRYRLNRIIDDIDLNNIPGYKETLDTLKITTAKKEKNIEYSDNISVHTDYCNMKHKKERKDDHSLDHNSLHADYSGSELDKNEKSEKSDNSNMTFTDNLYCDKCLNWELIQNKKLEKIKPSDPNNFVFYEDKYRNYKQNQINKKINEREELSKKAAENLRKILDKKNQDVLDFEEKNIRSSPEKYLRKYSNAEKNVNRELSPYDKNLKHYNMKEKIINRNPEKYILQERPEVEKYYKNYVDNPNYTARNFGESKYKTLYDYEQCQKDLLAQIEYKNQRKQREKEEESKKVKEKMFKSNELTDKENYNKLLRERKNKEDMYEENRKLIELKEKRKRKEKEEEEKYKQIYEEQQRLYESQLENERLEKLKRIDDLYKENLKNIELIRQRKDKEKQRDKEFYEKKEELREENKPLAEKEDVHFCKVEKLGRCCGCKRVLPRRLLTRNGHIFNKNI